MSQIQKAPLTVEFAIEKKLTFVDCVKYFRPDWDDQQCKDYLWEQTCFPMSTQDIIAQLNKQLGENACLEPTDTTNL